MDAFATAEDIAAEWRALTDAERVAAESHLVSAATLIRDEFRDRLGTDVPDDRLAAAKSVSIDIVKTALATAQWTGHVQYGRTEGPRTKSGTLNIPGGSLFLSDWHRDLLGLPVNPAPRWNFAKDDY